LSNSTLSRVKSTSTSSVCLVPSSFVKLYFLLSLSLHSSAFRFIPTFSHTQFSHTHYVLFYLHVLLASDETCEMKTLDTKSHCIGFIKHRQRISSVSRGVILSSVK
jgi:hypothetical protein